MKFSSKTFTTPSTLILIVLAIFLFYLFFMHDSDVLEDDTIEGFKKRKGPFRAKGYKGLW